MRSISSQFNVIFWNMLSDLRALIGLLLLSITVWVSFPAIIPAITFNKYPFIGLNIMVFGFSIPVVSGVNTVPKTDYRNKYFLIFFSYPGKCCDNA